MSLPIAYNKIIKLGDQNGTLVVVEVPRRVPKSTGKSSPYWMVLVKCNCGHTQNIPCKKWVNKEFSICRRCKIGGKNHYKWGGVGEMPGYAFYKTIHNSKRIGVEHTLTKKYLWNLFLKQNGKCALSGLDISFHSISHDEQTASLDRIDSSVGYVPENVQWIHKDVNKMKNEYDESYYISICKRVADDGNRIGSSQSNGKIHSTDKNKP